MLGVPPHPITLLDSWAVTFLCEIPSPLPSTRPAPENPILPEPSRDSCGITPLESTLADKHRVLPCFGRNRPPATSLESTLTSTPIRNPFRIRTYKKQGEGYPISSPTQCPSPRATAGMVSHKIPKSCRKLQFSMYSKSSFMLVSNDGSWRAVTCHNPVIPGFTSSRRRCSNV